MSALDQFEQLRRAGCSSVRKTGRCANGAQRDGGSVVHFVGFEDRRGWSPALCGTRPGRLSGGWDLIEKPFGGEFVCGRCARKLPTPGEQPCP